FFFSSRRRHTRFSRDWSSDVCSSDLEAVVPVPLAALDDEAEVPRVVVAELHLAMDVRGVGRGHEVKPVARVAEAVLHAATDRRRSEERRVGKEVSTRQWTENIVRTQE